MNVIREPRSVAHMESSALGGGWQYRINRIEKRKNSFAYEVLLAHEKPGKPYDKLYLWLAEFNSIEAAREAAGKMLVDWASHPHYILNI